MESNKGIETEIQVGVALSAFMGTVSLFFTGILIAQLKSFDQSIKVPIIFLIIATFSFIFSSTIYANAAGEITRHDPKRAHWYMAISNIVSEFLGLYLFVLAVPLVINAITSDQFLRLSVVVVALTGLTLYSLSAFSIVHRELGVGAKYLFSAIIAALGAMVASAQLQAGNWFAHLATLTVGVLVFATVMFCRQPKQLKKVAS